MLRFVVYFVSSKYTRGGTIEFKRSMRDIKLRWKKLRELQDERCCLESYCPLEEGVSAGNGYTRRQKMQIKLCRVMSEDEFLFLLFSSQEGGPRAGANQSDKFR